MTQQNKLQLKCRVLALGTPSGDSCVSVRAVPRIESLMIPTSKINNNTIDVVLLDQDRDTVVVQLPYRENTKPAAIRVKREEIV